jgi:DNA-binding NtrC family response regulator
MSPLGRVLIVDDEPHVAEMLQETLAFLGYAVHVAVTGPDALRLHAEHRPDIVLLDLTLPDMPGETVLERLRCADPRLPVIMITGNTDPERARRTLAEGAFDHLVKPFELDRLTRVLEAALAFRG